MSLVWLVTGSSSGLGEAFALEILARGDRVIATARNASDRLAHLKDAGAAVFDLDVTAPEAELSAKVQEAIKIYGQIDVLVNNAGIFNWGLVEEISPEDLMHQFNTNFLGSFKMTRAILPHFRERKVGKFLFVGSANGWRGFAGGSAYSVSKFALEGFVESLQKETSHLNIQSIIFEPGMFRTPVLAAGAKPSKLAEDPDYADLAAEIQRDLIESDGKQNGDPKKAVKRMIAVIRGEGMALGKEMPKRMPLGKDSLSFMREKCEATLRICAEWSEVIESTDFSNKA